TINGVVTGVHGSRPLVLVATSTITIGTALDVSSSVAGGAIGPASPSGLCAAPTVVPDGGAHGGAGGAGGSFMSRGGFGRNGDNTNPGRGQSAPADATAPAVLRAGCDGEAGGDGGTGNNAATVGHGGGAVYLVAGNTITLNGALIDASGSGAAGNGAFFSGG